MKESNGKRNRQQWEEDSDHKRGNGRRKGVREVHVEAEKERRGDVSETKEVA